MKKIFNPRQYVIIIIKLFDIFEKSEVGFKHLVNLFVDAYDM